MEGGAEKRWVNDIFFKKVKKENVKIVSPGTTGSHSSSQWNLFTRGSLRLCLVFGIRCHDFYVERVICLGILSMVNKLRLFLHKLT